MNRWKNYLIIAIVALFLAAAGYYGFQNNTPQEVVEPTAPVTVEVIRGDVRQTILAPGRLVWTDMTHVPFEDSGQITEVMVRPGDRAEEGW